MKEVTNAEIAQRVAADAAEFTANQVLVRIASGVWVHECMVHASTPLWVEPVKRGPGRPRKTPL